jgi:hypothetical protein
VTASALPPAPATYQSLQVRYQAPRACWLAAVVCVACVVCGVCVAQWANARSGSPRHWEEVGSRFTGAGSAACTGPQWPDTLQCVIVLALHRSRSPPVTSVTPAPSATANEW